MGKSVLRGAYRALPPADVQMVAACVHAISGRFFWLRERSRRKRQLGTPRDAGKLPDIRSAVGFHFAAP